ncbi:hypothetical protein ACJX0J_018834, partial [Zea mays]
MYSGEFYNYSGLYKFIAIFFDVDAGKNLWIHLYNNRFPQHILIAEAWDAGGLYQNVWLEWNVKVWTLYEFDDLESIIDRTLKRDFDTEEALWLLKIGLVCIPDSPKIKPSMSMVAKMLQ